MVATLGVGLRKILARTIDGAISQVEVKAVGRNSDCEVANSPLAKATNDVGGLRDKACSYPTSSVECRNRRGRSTKKCCRLRESATHRNESNDARNSIASPPQGSRRSKTTGWKG